MVNPRPSTGGAGLNELHEALTNGDLSGAAAFLAGFAGRTLGGSGAAALGAGDMPGNFDGFFRTLGGFTEGNGHVVAQIVALLRPGTAGTGSSETEQVAEHVSELGENIFGAVECRAAHAGIGRAEAVIVGPSFGVAENVVGFGGLLEFLFRLGIVRIVVGMILERQLSVGVLDLVVRSISGDAQNFIIIALTHEVFP